MRPATLALAAALCGALTAGCTDFHYHSDLACGQNGECPPGYFCDDTGGDICRVDLPGCGDGTVTSDEVCDDGNRTSGDGCRADCLKQEICGDGVQDTGEECDDGNATDTDDCPSTCKLATCGDGFAQAGVEECDDGNMIDTDACPSTCKAAVCGDGMVEIGTELCDDGDGIDADECDDQCRPSEVIGVAAGGTFTCALRASGKVRCWGWNGFGELGRGNTTQIGDDEEPAVSGDAVVGGRVVQIAASEADVCALLDTGKVRCWGGGFTRGELGYGNTNVIGDDETPASAGDVDVGGTVVQIVTGQEHTCALLDTGKVRCWGVGAFGRLGYGNIIDIGDNETPASAGDVDVGGTVVQIAAGGAHTCALLDTGKVRCWGLNNLGQLGRVGNNIGDDETPASVGPIDLGGTAVQITAGFEHTCALLDTGKVRCWGNGAEGELGYGNTSNVSQPASAGDVDVGGTVVQIAAGGYHTCALLDTGKVRCWGNSADGRLGYPGVGNIGDTETPASVGDVDVGGLVTRIAAGMSNTCALLDTGKVRCWGDGSFGQLGHAALDDVGDDETPASVGDIRVGGDVVQVDGGLWVMCAVLDTGRVRCWGDGRNGTLGHGNTDVIGDNEAPASAGEVAVGGRVTQIAVGDGQACALLDTGKVRCWGGGGLLGYGNTTTIGDDELPAVAGDVDVGGTVVQIAAGGYRVCAIMASGGLRCWGSSGNNAPLGYGNTDNIGDDETPASVGDIDVGGTVKQVAMGELDTCVLLDTGGVRCWGDGADGKLGYGNTNTIGDDETPASVGDVQIGGTAVEIAVADYLTCALLDTGAVTCWGAGGYLGYGNTDTIGDDETPASVGPVNVGGTVSHIYGGGDQVCALLDTGAVKCWGGGDLGELGYGNTDIIGDDETPADVGTVDVGETVLGMGLSSVSTCAIIKDGRLRCWGDDTYGQLGYGNTVRIGDDETPATAGDVLVF